MTRDRLGSTLSELDEELKSIEKESAKKSGGGAHYLQAAEGLDYDFVKQERDFI